MATLSGKMAGVFSNLSAEAAELVSEVRAGVVVVRGRQGGQGSGVVWRQDGVVLTNEHVVAGQRGAEVALADGRRVEATVVRRDPARDLAALQLPVKGLPAVPVGESRKLRTGELILAVGNPLGVERAVTVGIVSGTAQEVRVGRQRLPEMIQADVDLYPGNSGGPLVDARGRVVGINSMVTGPGMALAVPSHVAEGFLDEGARGSRPRLGVILGSVELPQAIARPLGLPEDRGLMVYSVAGGSPAERAGLLPGDLLVSVEGQKVTAAEELAHRISQLGPERPARLELLRAGRLIEVVTIV
jgi:serine protease Do